MYMVELVKGEDVIALAVVEQNGTITWTAPTQGGYKYCSKFINKDRAIKAASKVEQKYRFMKDDAVRARVVSEYGGPIEGSKASVPEKKKDRIRR